MGLARLLGADVDFHVVGSAYQGHGGNSAGHQFQHWAPARWPGQRTPPPAPGSPGRAQPQF
eukprot:4153712-Lingulodinium_polyedra.AAC.1